MAAKVEMEFASKGSDGTVRAFEATDAAILKNTSSLRAHAQENAKQVNILRAQRTAQEDWQKTLQKGQQIERANVSDKQRYLDQMKDLRALHTAGAISADALAAEQKKLQKVYLDAIGVTDRKKASEKAAADAVREAAAIVQASLSPQQRYDQNVERLNAHLAANRMTVEQHAAAMAQERAALDKATGAIDRLRDAEQRESKAAAEARAIIESLKSPLERYRDTMAGLKVHLDAGRISQDQYNRKAVEAKNALHEQEAAGQKASRVRFDGVTNSLRGITTAIMGGGVVAAINSILDAHKRLNDQVNQTTTDVTPALATMINQTGLQGADADNATGRVFDIATKRRIDVREAAFAGAELAGAGVDANEATGGILDEIFKGMNAMGVKERESPLKAGDFSKALLAYIKSQGVDVPQREDFRKTIGSLYALFKKTNLQAEDLTFLGEVASVASQVMEQQEQLALYAQLRETKSPAEAATAFRQVVTKIQTARGNEKAAGALEGPDAEAMAKLKAKGKAAATNLGLNLDDVDLVGESIDVVLDRLQKALEKVAPKERLTILKDIVGDEAAPAFSALINKGGAPIREKVGMTGDKGILAQLDKDAASREVLPTAIAVAQQNEKFRQERERYTGTDIVRREVEAVMAERQVDAKSRETAMTFFDKGVGGGDRTAAKAGLTAAGLGTDEIVDEVMDRVSRLRREKGFDQPVNQAAGIGLANADERAGANVQAAQGFVPAARAKNARTVAEEAFANLDFASQSGIPFDGVDSLQFNPATAARGKLKTIESKANTLQPGEIEGETIRILEETLQSLNPADQKFNTPTFKRSIEELKRLQQRARDKANARGNEETPDGEPNQRPETPAGGGEAARGPVVSFNTRNTENLLREQNSLVSQQTAALKQQADAIGELARAVQHGAGPKESKSMALYPGSRTSFATMHGRVS